MDRDKFHLPGKHYLLSHSVGAQPKTFEAAFAAGYAEQWRSAGFGVWDPWFEALERYKKGLAPIIGAHAKDICPLSNVSSGIAKVLFSLPERARRTKIVLTEDDFPTVGFALAQGQRMGYELVFLPGGDRLADPDAWAPAFHDDVQLVVATQVYSNSSVLAPCKEIARRARERGVFCFLDIAQAAGAVPVELNEWAADFAVGTSLKYLCGGTGAAYLWADPDAAARSAPSMWAGFLTNRRFEFDIHHFEFAEGANRYTGGTPSIGPAAGATAGQNIINAHGVEAIYAHNQNLLTRLFSKIPTENILSHTGQGTRRQRGNRPRQQL